MLKDFIRKIRRAINEAPSPVLIELEMFYSVLSASCLRIPEQEITPSMIEYFAELTQKVKAMIEEGGNLNREKIHQELTQMLKPLQKVPARGPHEISKNIWAHFADEKFLAQVREERKKANTIAAAYAAKHNKIRVHGCHEISYNFWVTTFKADYAAHFDVFWASFLEYISKQPFYSMFISESSRQKIHEIVDPTRKYYITSANLNDLMVKMSQPEFLEILAEHNSLKRKSQPFESYSSIFLKYHRKHDGVEDSGVECNFPENQPIELNGRAIKCEGKHPTQCKYPPTIRFGALQDSDFWIKGKYISRRQFMIIEEPIPTLILSTEQE